MVQLPSRFDGRVVVSLKETSDLLGVSAKQIYNRLYSGTFPLLPIRIGRLIFFSVDAIRSLALPLPQKHGKRG
jgi:predicted DNA-binding transcriptional regulator AlpA